MQPGACMPSCPQTTLFLCQLPMTSGIDNKSKAIFDKRGNCCCLLNHQLSISSSGKTRS
ncbi:hypothetical protein B0T17DRAFT_543947 [Bombardia bombarda]|uniref:Uncharacterized protein n=1 Tax=Bombardia bombarda TaxID=252184 RepID=A0AA39TU42_9PEZI|nr:hypothetical protein B0T17DRAFT_543947 [Bombardia bombarda]